MIQLHINGGLISQQIEECLVNLIMQAAAQATTFRFISS